MNLWLTFPLENYLALYGAIVYGIDSQVALDAVMGKKPRIMVKRHKSRAAFLDIAKKAVTEQGLSVTAAATLHGVPRSTLSLYLRKDGVKSKAGRKKGSYKNDF